MIKVYLVPIAVEELLPNGRILEGTGPVYQYAAETKHETFYGYVRAATREEAQKQATIELEKDGLNPLTLQFVRYPSEA